MEKNLFYEETEELLDDIAETAMELRSQPNSAELLNRLFGADYPMGAAPPARLPARIFEKRLTDPARHLRPLRYGCPFGNHQRTSLSSWWQMNPAVE